jgi:hypothetical protein
MRSLLTARDFPLAELTAMRLDGDVVAVGPAFAPYDDVPDPTQRAVALRDLAGDRLVAERRTAAWIWGAIGSPPFPWELCAIDGYRVALAPEPGVVVREVVMLPGEVRYLAGVGVTTPTRTAADLVRFVEAWTPDDAQLVADLLALTRTDPETVRTALDRFKLSHRKRALERLATLPRPGWVDPREINRC